MKVVESVRSEFKMTLQHIDWIDQDTRVKAVDKLSKMMIVVGSPEQILNETNIEQIYESVCN